MIRFKILTLLILFSLSSVGQNEAEKIFIKATSRLLTTNMEMSLNQKTTDKKGRVKEKTFDVLLAKFGEEEKTKMILKAPERAAGIIIVMSKIPDEDGIIEVYTPANGKTRKMIANRKNMATVGSDFSFSNYSSTNWKDLDIQLLEQQEIDGKPCNVLEVKDKEKTDGGKAELVIEDESYNIIQIKTFGEKGKQKSISKLDNFLPVDGSKGKFQPRFIQTENLEKNQKSELQVLKISMLSNPMKEDFVIDKKEEVIEN
jgi:outer membrane lipoprotein-sorting protein